MAQQHDEEETDARAREENARLHAEVAGLRGYLECLVDLSSAGQAPASPPDPNALLDRMLAHAMRATGATDASVLAHDDASGELVFILIRGENPNAELLGKRVPRGRGVAAWVAQSRRATIVNDAATDDRFYCELDMQNQYHTRSLLAAPLVGADRLLGVVEMVNKRGGVLFTTGNQNALSLICRFAGAALAGGLGSRSVTATRGRPGG